MTSRRRAATFKQVNVIGEYYTAKYIINRRLLAFIKVQQTDDLEYFICRRLCIMSEDLTDFNLIILKN